MSAPRQATAHAVRAPRLEELEAVAAVVGASQTRDLGAPRTTSDEIAGQWALPGFALEQDAWVVEHAGAPAGAAWLMPGTGILVVEVAPDACGRGIGTALRQAAEARAALALKGDITIKQHAMRVNVAARSLLIDAGYRRTHTYLRMRRDLRRELAPAAFPERLRVTTARPWADDEAIYDLAMRAFAQTPDFRRRPAPLWCAKHLREGVLYERASPLAWDGDELVGLVLAEPADATGIPRIGVVAVDPRARGRGIGRALVLASLGAMARDGAELGELDVLEGNPAVAMYERAGLRVEMAEDRFEREPCMAS
jgi:mycothiol synthase